MDVKPEYLAIFCEEAADQLREWEEALLALETAPGDSDQLNGMFRAIHTLKGSSGFIGFDALQKVAHDLESALSDVRDGSHAWDPSLADILFKGLDICKAMIDAFSNGTVADVDIDSFLTRLGARAAANTPSPAATAPAPAPLAPAASTLEPTAPAPTLACPQPATGTTRAFALAIRIDGQPREAYLRSFLVKARLERLGRIVAVEPLPETLRDSDEPFAYTVTLEAEGDPAALAAGLDIDQVAITPVASAAAVEDRPDAAPAIRSEQLIKAARPEEVVRVSVQKLDTLLNLVGELVIHSSGFVAIADQLKEDFGKTKHIYDLEEKTESLSAITRDLQDGIMKARMLPIANVFNRFRRVVRDLAKASGKKVALEVFGEETEIDKKVIDRIGEPLVHLVRNAMDHGLETEEERAAAGKSNIGTIRLGAYQEGDHICIEVSDDGRGLDREAILAKALEKGLLRPEEAATAGTERILGFIFLPGFSTARTVTDISGRGVGMDAVNRAVDELNGNVRVRSTPRAGTSVTISVPLTMAIVTAVLVEVNGAMYAIPLSAVREILKTDGTLLQTVGNRRVIVVRGEVLALVNLAAALQAGELPTGAGTETGLPVVVVDFEGKKIGLEVSKISGTREVVIKSLSRHYREVEGLIGASILGNGRIALIVDVETLISLHYHGSNGRATGRDGRFDVGARIETGESPAAAMPARPQALATPALPTPALATQALATPALAAPALATPALAAPAPAAEAPPPVRPPAPATPLEAQPAEEPRTVASLAARMADKGRLLDDVNNDGAVQASLSLSQFTGQDIRVSFPESRLVAIRDVAELMGGEEATVGGIYVGVQGGLTAGILLVLPEKNILRIDDLIHGRPPGTTQDMAEVDLSGLAEMGNILASCFINAMADAACLEVNPEVPEISVDMCLPVLDSVIARFNQPGDSILFTEAVIYGAESEDVVCHQLLFLEPSSFERLLDSLAARDAAVATQG